MIKVITIDNVHLYGAEYKAQYRLRHKAFLERQKYQVFSYRNMEYDQYDNPSAVYLVKTCPITGEALGVSRLTPISHRSMLKDIFPELINDHSLFSDRHTWEGTRFCIERNLEPASRKQICNELVAAYLEFGLQKNIRRIVGMMPKLIFRSVFQEAGCPFEFLGPPIRIDRQIIQAAMMDVSIDNLNKVREKCSLHSEVILNQPFLSNIVTAA